MTDERMNLHAQRIGMMRANPNRTSRPARADRGKTGDGIDRKAMWKRVMAKINAERAASSIE